MNIGRFDISNMAILLSNESINQHKPNQNFVKNFIKLFISVYMEMQRTNPGSLKNKLHYLISKQYKVAVTGRLPVAHCIRTDRQTGNRD